MTLLVVASPCALVLSIPSAILAAIAWGARNGILFRGGAAIEKLAEVDLVALDKTGTLTTGELAVVGCESFPPGREQEVIELAYALEMNSQHPIARAITQHGEDARRARAARSRSLSRSPARACAGRQDGAHGAAGAPRAAGGGAAGRVGPAAAAGRRRAERGLGARPGASSAACCCRMRSARSRATCWRGCDAGGIRTVMLTGDRSHAAEAVARELGLDEVQAGLSPEDKVAAIQAFREQGYKVAMVGDGVNDAPSLAAAHVSRGDGRARQRRRARAEPRSS